MRNDSFVPGDVIDAAFELAGPSLGVRTVKGFFRWICYVLCAVGMVLLLMIFADFAGKGKLENAIVVGLLFSIIPGCFAVLAWILRPRKRVGVPHVNKEGTGINSAMSQTLVASEVPELAWPSTRIWRRAIRSSTSEIPSEGDTWKLKSQGRPEGSRLWPVLKWTIGLPLLILWKIGWEVFKPVLASVVGSSIGDNAANRLFNVSPTRRDGEVCIPHALVIAALNGRQGKVIGHNGTYLGYTMNNKLYDADNKLVGHIGSRNGRPALLDPYYRLIQTLD